jgi:hypothetical protein
LWKVFHQSRELGTPQPIGIEYDLGGFDRVVIIAEHTAQEELRAAVAEDERHCRRDDAARELAQKVLQAESAAEARKLAQTYLEG